MLNHHIKVGTQVSPRYEDSFSGLNKNSLGKVVKIKEIGRDHKDLGSWGELCDPA